jgi:serine/threonine protein kinase
MNAAGSLKESVLKIYTRQILTGLEYLHAHQIMHRDIKGANILVDNTGLIKLADFGASKKIEDLVTLGREALPDASLVSWSFAFTSRLCNTLL